MTHQMVVIIAKDQDAAVEVAKRLIDESIKFITDPLPCDEWEFSFALEGGRKAIAEQIARENTVRSVRIIPGHFDEFSGKVIL